MIIYFDTETTGLSPGRIVQLSYIIEEDNGKIIGKNFFFAVDYVPIEAQLIHGFSEEKLKVLSGGKVFDDCIDEVQNDFETADIIVAHNIGFDIKFMEAEYERLDRKFCFNNKFDSMKGFKDVCKLQSTKYGYKFPKLTEVGNFLGISEVGVNELSTQLFGSDGVNAHDARYDTTLLYKCCSNYMRFHPDFMDK